jgi:hypothetical protein
MTSVASRRIRDVPAKTDLPVLAVLGVTAAAVIRTPPLKSAGLRR